MCITDHNKARLVSHDEVNEIVDKAIGGWYYWKKVIVKFLSRS